MHKDKLQRIIMAILVTEVKKKIQILVSHRIQASVTTLWRQEAEHLWNLNQEAWTQRYQTQPRASMAYRVKMGELRKWLY